MTNKVVVINADRNVSIANYRDIAGDYLLVTSIFATIQGEGPYAGWPSVFVRLAGCNIGAKDRCDFCDTKFFFDQGKKMTVKQVMAVVHQLMPNHRRKLVVITGGEPLLQMNSLGQLCEALEAYTSKVQIETNGMLLKKDSLLTADVVISPKAVHAEHGYSQIKPEWFLRLSLANTYLKYVLTADPESPYHEVPKQALMASAEKRLPVYVSGMCVYKKSPGDDEVSNAWDPEQVDQEETAKNYAYTAQYAMKHGLLVSYQMHLFGNIP